MLKNGAASVISSSDTVGGRGRSFEGAFIDNLYLWGAFIQSITVFLQNTTELYKYISIAEKHYNLCNI